MVKTLEEQFRDEVLSLADQFAIDISAFYEQRCGMVGRMYKASGRVPDVLDPADVYGNPNFDRFWDWTYTILFEVEADCWNDLCRECAHGIDALISVKTEFGERFDYKCRPGYSPKRVVHS